MYFQTVFVTNGCYVEIWLFISIKYLPEKYLEKVPSYEKIKHDLLIVLNVR